MSAGWEIGDLALCVDAGIHDCTVTWIAPMPEKGKIYTVAGLFMDISDLNLVLEELHRDCGIGLRAWRFRKIRPDEHEPCEEEFVTLLNRTKQPEKLPMSAALSRFGDVPTAFVEAEIEFERKYAELREWVRGERK